MVGVHVRSWQVAYRGLFPDDYLDGLRAEDRLAQGLRRLLCLLAWRKWGL